MKNIKHNILLQKIQLEKDSDSFAKIYDVYIERMYRFVYFKVGSRQEAEDITSELFLKLWKYLTEKKNKVDSLNGLIYQMARNLVIDHYRKKAKKQECSLEQVIHLPGDTDIEYAAHITVESERLLKHINKLKQEYQEIVLLKYIEGLSTKEISLATGKKKTAVRVTLHRAIKVLQKMLGD